jgi:antirestriction protein ArdC
MAKKQYTDAERAEYRAAKRTQQREDLERAARALLSSDGWRTWAETRARFHDYSLGNCMLIAMQRPDATHVAGFHKWRELGRSVRKGEHGIRILAPMIVGGSKDERSQLRANGRTDAEADGWQTDGGPRVTFRGVSVFDISQTDGDPLPERPDAQPITGDSHAEYLPRLEGWAAAQGISVSRERLEHGGGYYSDKDRRVVLSDALGSPNRELRTLLHELAHALGVPNYREHGRDASEVIVETAAFIAAGAIGLDTSGESVPYVAGWGEDGKLDAIRKCAELVDGIARQLEGACGLATKR